ncbi:MAG: hypothetical protein R2850_02465 [Bacteroidia bacterium]
MALLALYITYLGGSGVEFPHSMIVNEYDELIVFGTTGSKIFQLPTVRPQPLSEAGLLPNV